MLFSDPSPSDNSPVGNSLAENPSYANVISDNFTADKRVRVTNADTYTKADSARISPSFVNKGLARYNLCEFYWRNIRMKNFKILFWRSCSIFKTRSSAFIIFLGKCPQKGDSSIVSTVNSTFKSHLLSALALRMVMRSSSAVLRREGRSAAATVITPLRAGHQSRDFAQKYILIFKWSFIDINEFKTFNQRCHARNCVIVSVICNETQHCMVHRSVTYLDIFLMETDCTALVAEAAKQLQCVQRGFVRYVKEGSWD